MTFEAIVLAVRAPSIGFVDTGNLRRLVHLAAGVALGALHRRPPADRRRGRHLQQRHHRRPKRRPAARPGLLDAPSAAVRAVLGSVTSRDPVAFVGSFEGISFVGVAVVSLAVVGLVDGAQPQRATPADDRAGRLRRGQPPSGPAGPRTIVFRAAAPSRAGVRPGARLLALAHRGRPGAGGAARPRDSTRSLRAQVTRRTLVTSARDRGHRRRPRRRSARRGRPRCSCSGRCSPCLALGAVALAVATGGVRRRVGTGFLAAAVVLELGIMSTHSLSPARADGHRPSPAPRYESATTHWLQGRPGYVISFTDDLQGPEYSLPGLRPNANVLVGVRSVDGYDGGVQITKRWAAALLRLDPARDLDLPLRNAVPLPARPGRPRTARRPLRPDRPPAAGRRRWCPAGSVRRASR